PFGVFVPAITFPDIAELWGEVGALAEQRVAIDAGVALPDMLAADDTLAQCSVRRAGRGHVEMGVQGQCNKDDEEESRATIENIARCGLCQAFWHPIHPRIPDLGRSGLPGIRIRNHAVPLPASRKQPAINSD